MFMMPIAARAPGILRRPILLISVSIFRQMMFVYIYRQYAAEPDTTVIFSEKQGMPENTIKEKYMGIFKLASFLCIISKVFDTSEIVSLLWFSVVSSFHFQLN